MFNFFKNLQEREKKLILISSSLLILFVLFFLIKNTYETYSRSSLNLLKAKSDYEYVFNKINNLQRSLSKNNLDRNSINIIIENNSFENSITEIEFNEIDSSIVIRFSSLNIVDAISFIEKLISNHSNQLISIKYKNFDSKVITELKFD
jgi:hypothetical protein